MGANGKSTVNKPAKRGEGTLRERWVLVMKDFLVAQDLQAVRSFPAAREDMGSTS
jgi:hypothetical protein